MITFDDRALARFGRLDIDDPRDLGLDSRVSGRLNHGETANAYRLRDPARRHEPPGVLLTRLSTLRLGPHLLLACNSDRYGTEVAVRGAGMPRTCLGLMLRGAARVATAEGPEVTLDGAQGAIFRGDPGLRLDTGDGSARLNLWVSDGLLQRMLAALLEDDPRGPPRFHPVLDWSRGGGAGLLRLLRHLAEELAEPDGMATNPAALDAFAELVADAILRRLPHDRSAALEGPRSPAIPAHLKRAEAYVRAQAATPMTLTEVAAAAGCSLRTLHEAFRRFRDTTPHAAMQAIRLEQVRAALAAERDLPPREAARRFGFTHMTRFAAAYAARFGETPAETRQRRAG